MHILFKLGILFKILSFCVLAKRLSTEKLHTLILNSDHKIEMSWAIDWSSEEVLFHIENAFTHSEWFYIGFSKRGEIQNSDICLFYNVDGFRNSTDLYTNEDGTEVNEDSLQNCELLRIDSTSVAFKREFDTCDAQDLRMHEGTMYLLWGKGSGTFDASSLVVSSGGHQHHHVNSDSKPTESGTSNKVNGLQMVQLLRADNIAIPEKDIHEIDVRIGNITVPAKETTYWCHIQKLPSFLNEAKHHIVQFEPLIEAQGLVHHLEVFHCETDAKTEIPLYNGDCTEAPKETKVCSKVISLWAMGASVFTYPAEAGLPVGGPDYNPFIRLEVHYNNPELIEGRMDSSGMRIKLISKLRKYDAAVMELGLEYTDKMAIPPGQFGFPLSGYCIAECTNVALPPSGITIFGSQLHTHLTGLRVLTRHFRGDQELGEINRDDYFSQHFQEIRSLRLKRKVLPGDALVTTCYYNTDGYDKPVLGGFSISDEMCVNYVHYYPETKLELCKSAVSEKTLADYFEFMKNKEGQNGIVIGGARSENYRSIDYSADWRVAELYDMYIHEPLSMQCNRSDGVRFDGFNWEGAPITPVKIQVPKPKGYCFDFPPWTKPLNKGRCDMLGECIY